MSQKPNVNRVIQTLQQLRNFFVPSSYVEIAALTGMGVMIALAMWVTGNSYFSQGSLWGELTSVGAIALFFIYSYESAKAGENRVEYPEIEAIIESEEDERKRAWDRASEIIAHARQLGEALFEERYDVTGTITKHELQVSRDMIAHMILQHHLTTEADEDVVAIIDDLLDGCMYDVEGNAFASLIFDVTPFAVSEGRPAASAAFLAYRTLANAADFEHRLGAASPTAMDDVLAKVQEDWLNDEE